MTDQDILEAASIAYCKFLSAILWDDVVYMAGIKEGKDKFLSNAVLSLRKGSKYLQGDFYSEAALRKVQIKDFTNLVHEHMIPKTRYIQKPCEDEARNNSLTPEFVLDLVKKYWKIAIVTKEEDNVLHKTRMPNSWDGENIFDRYDSAGISLIKRPF